MAANISAFNTVFSYDLWQQYVKTDRPDPTNPRRRPVATVGAPWPHRGRRHRLWLHELMDYLQTLLASSKRPLFATLHPGHVLEADDADRGWMGLVSGTLAAVAVASSGETRSGRRRWVLPLGARARASSPPRRVRRRHHRSASPSAGDAPKPVARSPDSSTPRRRRGASAPTPTRTGCPGTSRRPSWPGIALVMVIVLNVIFR
jgi:SSS family solute:Na+ symporter